MHRDSWLFTIYSVSSSLPVETILTQFLHTINNDHQRCNYNTVYLILIKLYTLHSSGKITNRLVFKNNIILFRLIRTWKRCRLYGRNIIFYCRMRTVSRPSAPSCSYAHGVGCRLSRNAVLGRTHFLDEFYISPTSPPHTKNVSNSLYSKFHNCVLYWNVSKAFSFVLSYPLFSPLLSFCTTEYYKFFFTTNTFYFLQ